MPQSIIDGQTYGNFHRKLFVLSSGGPFLDGYLLSIIGVALMGVSGEMGLGAVQKGLLGAAALIGVLVGGLVFGWITDRVGRQVMYTIDLIALVVASALSLFVTDVWQLIALRFVVGIAIGADYPIATSMLAEWLPANRRGRMMGALIAAWFTGAAASYAVGYVIVAFGGEGLWRWALASAAVPGVIILLARIGTPESPRWLLRQGRREDAREAIRVAFGRYPTADEIDHLAETEPPRRPYLSKVFEGEYLKRVLFVGGFWTCQVTTAVAIMTFYPVVLGMYGFEEGGSALLWSTVMSLVTLVGCVPCMWWVERFGRRPVIIWTFACVALSLAVLGLFPAMSVTVVGLVFILNSLAHGGGNILQWIYPTELFPTDIRASAVGVASAISRLGAAAGTYLLPVGLNQFGLGTTMLVGAAVAALGTAICVVWAPETRGYALHEVSEAEAPQKIVSAA